MVGGRGGSDTGDDIAEESGVSVDLNRWWWGIQEGMT